MKSIKIFKVLRLEVFPLRITKIFNTTTYISFAAICEKWMNLDLFEINVFASTAIFQKSKTPVITYKH